LMPVDEDLFVQDCRINNIDPASANVASLGSTDDPYQGVLIR